MGSAVFRRHRDTSPTANESALKVAPVDVDLEIRRRIQDRGRITFAEFMELSLFWPDGGYYSTPDNIGHRGDFYTAPSAHPAFGALLCLQLLQMWRLLDCPSTFWVVEIGAGNGILCHDVVEYSSYLPEEFGESLRYLCLDRLAEPGAEDELLEGARRKADRFAAQEIPLRKIKGCVLSNELLDCFPVHRVTVVDGELKEVYLALEHGNLVEMLDSPSTTQLEEHLDFLGITLPEGFNAEINLAMEPWLRSVSSAMETGFLITVDYGHLAKDLYSRQLSRGTLTGFYKHTQIDNPYTRIGKQDITAQVDFTSLIESGKDHGLVPVGFSTQREFFECLGIQRSMTGLLSMGLRQRELEANRLGMLEIIRPGGMGEFKVLVQGKGVGKPSLWGYESSAEFETIQVDLPVPLLKPHHTPLLEGRYPHLSFEWEGLWPTEDEGTSGTGAS